MPRRQSGIGRPGYTSSSENNDNEEDKSSGDEAYNENYNQKRGQNFAQPGGQSYRGVFRPQISKLSLRVKVIVK